jgi:hypothetical protein
MRPEGPEATTAYFLANISLNAAVLVPLFILWIASLRLVRSQRDPSRSAFMWMKLALPLFAL